MSPRSRSVLRWGLRGVAAVAIVLLLARLGGGPFLAGLARLTGSAVAVAVALTASATVAASWRWSALARAFGAPLPLRAAVLAYSRSQLLNSVLPGGVVGDVGRALEAPGPRRATAKAVVWDRASGQVVQLALLVAALAATGSVGIAAGIGAGMLVAAAGVALLGRGAGGGGLRRAARSVRMDLRLVRSRPGVLLPVLGGSAAVAILHAGVFVLGAVTTGTPADLGRLLPIALLVQTALALPLGFGGLGAREGAAAAAFAAAGLGAAQGVSAGIAAGALGLVAVLPGVVPLAAAHLHRPAVAR